MSGRTEPQVRSIGTDPVAFTEFYRAHVDEVTRFVARRVADPQLIADLTADVFLAVIEAAARYRGSHGGPRTWLFGIARNVIAAEFRRTAREQRAASLIAGRRLLDADDVGRLTERIDALRQVREMHAALRALPEGERAVLELVSVDGLSCGGGGIGTQYRPGGRPGPAAPRPPGAAVRPRRAARRGRGQVGGRGHVVSVDEMRPPGRFECRLEAELVGVVSERAAGQRRPSGRAVAAMRRPAVRAGVLAAGIAAAAAAAAAAFAFAGPSLGGRPAAPSQTAGGAVHIRTAAFTVDTNADGTVSVTWNKSRYIQNVLDVASLQRALRAAGFPVLIRQGVFCQGPHDSGQLGEGGVGPGVDRVMTGENRPGGEVAFVFTPSAMPAGEELFIGYLSPAQVAITHGRPGSIERLVPAGVPLTCTTQLPVAG